MSKIDTSSKKSGAIAEYLQSLDVLATNVSELAKIITYAWQANLTPMLVGAAGSGKTEVIKQLAKQRDAILVHIYVAHSGSEEIKGVMFRNEDNTDTYKILANQEIYEPVKEAIETGRELVLFLDELNRASDQDSLNAIFSMISKRGVPGLDFPDNVRLVAAGNPPTGKYSVAQMTDDAFVRRLLWLGVTVDASAWLRYARGENLDLRLTEVEDGFQLERLPIHPKVISYIQANPDNLAPEELANQGRPHPNPASWDKVSDVLKVLESAKVKSAKVFKILLSGLIGGATANGFYSAYIDGRLQISPDEIISGEWSAIQKKLKGMREESRHDLMGETIRALCYKLKLDRPELSKESASNIVGLLDLVDEDQQGTFASLLTATDLPENEQDEFRTYKESMTKMLQGDDRFNRISQNLLDLRGAK